MNRKQRRAAAKTGKASGSTHIGAAVAGAGAVAAHLRMGLEHHQAGRLGDAEVYYRQVLAREPGNAQALHLLGVAAGQSGLAGVSAELLTEAIKRDQSNPFYLSDLGNALQAMSQFEAAVASSD